ncbi:MAG TPA: acetyl-CoA carboxylase biotin carboxyl carrier protein [Gemmatimonadaceae bacterium]|jgi:acetyl-CoA carboxylase biotin carboxyl carrier protein|nr:acetyl-CoA carboxylase biotin carboxyl carrier protein [Gemmatimonadaceae bacterium]
MIDLRYVKKLIELLDGSSVDSIEISSDKGMKIRLSKSPSQRGAVQVAAPVSVPVLAAPAVARLTPVEGVATQPAESDGKPEPPRLKLLEIKSPMVGTFYASPEPGAKAYVTEGQRIARGQMVCIIEAMKIMNEIESEFAGMVKEVLVQDAHPVEYGQVLFRIDPNG